jgi:hypothetical protein
MTLTELLVELDDCELSRDGDYILISTPAGIDPRSDEWAGIRAGIREHKQKLLSLLPRVRPSEAPPKVHGPDGNVIMVSEGEPTP